jgi:SAM-dependent methyltransferase
MSETCHRRSTCRLCAGSDLQEVLSLEPTPPANAFVPKELVGKDQAVFPLDIFFCQSCGHVQLLDVVDPKILFENYVYVSGTSPVFVKHFEDYANDVLNTYQPPKGAMVVDIGSNDGTLLSFFKKAGQTVLGIDPAKGISQDATERGIETWCDFFTPELSAKINQEHAPAHVITANNVFAHADDLVGMVHSIRELLAPEGVFIFEVSYLVDVFEKTLFDTIYHEHVAYHSVKPLQQFFADNRMELISAKRIGTHGGSLRGVAQLRSGPHIKQPSVNKMIALEACLGLDQAKTFEAFGRHIDEIKAELTSLLKSLKADGKTIAGFGAPAKATTLMYHFGIGPDIIDFIVDDSPLKQNLYAPGLHIPVLPSQAIYEQKPDVVVILAWNFAEPIMKNHARYQEQGGQFIVPLPEVRVFTSP